MIDEKKDCKVTFRVSSSDYDYLRALAYMGGMTVSKFVRSLAQSSITAVKLQERKGAFHLEDFKALFDDKL